MNVPGAKLFMFAITAALATCGAMVLVHQFSESSDSITRFCCDVAGAYLIIDSVAWARKINRL